ASVREEFELCEQSAAANGPPDCWRPHDLRRRFAGWWPLGLDQRRAAQGQSGLLPPFLQKLLAHGRHNALRPVRQRAVSAPSVSRATTDLGRKPHGPPSI